MHGEPELLGILKLKCWEASGALAYDSLCRAVLWREMNFESAVEGTSEA